jgi:hypothetical protein
MGNQECFMLQSPRPLPFLAASLAAMLLVFNPPMSGAEEADEAAAVPAEYQVAQASDGSSTAAEIDAEIDEIEREKADAYETSVSPAQVGKGAVGACPRDRDATVLR